MSITSSFSSIAGRNPASLPSSSSSATSNHHCYFRPILIGRSYSLAIKNSLNDGPLRRPVAPSSPSPSPATPTLKPSPSPTRNLPVEPGPAPSAEADEGKGGFVTLEFQRQKARELQEYFKKKKLQEADSGPSLGFVDKNEIINGRWAMFGFAVGLLTEYATGSDFVDQVKILLSNFGIVDLD